MIYLLLITLLLTPAYVVRFELGDIPTNLLMLWVFFVWMSFFIWLITKKQLLTFWTAVQNVSKPILIIIGLFFLSGLLSLFVNGFDRAKLGQFIILFLQPISVFFICQFIFDQQPRAKNYLVLNTYYLLAIAGLYAAFQYFTLIGLPASWWGNSNEPKRALSFFVHPNFYALWSAPLLAFLVPDVFENLKSKILNQKSFLWLFGALGLFLSLSRAAWLGLAAAIGIYLIIAADKKIRRIALSAAIVMILVIVSVPNLRWRFVLPFYGEKSAVSRLSLWHTGTKTIKESPILGLGLTGFSKNWEKLNTDPNIDSHNFPHNIFLNFWVETGLLGLISFFGLTIVLIYRGLKSAMVPIVGHSGDNSNIKLGIALFLICILFQGLLDNPYFKNDLAIIFWIILSLI